MLVVLSTTFILVDLFVAIMQVTVSVEIIQLQVSAPFMQVKVSAANMWVMIFIEIMHMEVSVTIMQVVLFLQCIIPIMPTDLHEAAGVTHILKYSPACQRSYLFTRISALPNIFVRINS